jgi:hypothetical protein
VGAFDADRPAATLRLAAQTIPLALAAVVSYPPSLLPRPDTQGHSDRLPYVIPLNPVNPALARDGKVPIVAGWGNVAAEMTYQAAVRDAVIDAIVTQSLTRDMFRDGMSSPTAGCSSTVAPSSTTRCTASRGPPRTTRPPTRSPIWQHGSSHFFFTKPGPQGYRHDAVLLRVTNVAVKTTLRRPCVARA